MRCAPDMKRAVTHGIIMSFLRLNLPFVGALPIEKAVYTIRDELPPVVLGEHPRNRTIVVAFCIAYAFLLALAQGKLSSSLHVVVSL